MPDNYAPLKALVWLIALALCLSGWALFFGEIGRALF
jgi:hypothetical protein